MAIVQRFEIFRILTVWIPIQFQARDHFEANVLGDLHGRGAECIDWWGLDGRCPEFASLVIDFEHAGLVTAMKLCYYDGRILLPLTHRKYCAK